jgi:hypothetical protein
MFAGNPTLLTEGRDTICLVLGQRFKKWLQVLRPSLLSPANTLLPPAI